jgi:hypothetical protein
LLGALSLAGCSGGSGAQVTPAPSAVTTACVTALSRAPGTVLGHPRTGLRAAGTAAWGPPDVVLRCGLPALGPTSLPCLSVDGIDWVFDDRGQDLVFTTFGRAPAVEVRVPGQVGRSNATGALVDVRPVAQALPRNQRRCAGPGDG